MENPNKSFIHKQFVTKIYKRSPERSQDSSFLEDRTSLNANSSFESLKSGKSRGTPSIQRLSGVKKRDSDLQNKESMEIFVEFLTELLRSQGDVQENVMNKVYSVTKALNDNFAKNPEFSLQFYIVMSEILNSISEVNEGNFMDLQSKIEEALSLTNDGITEMEQLTSLKKHIAKINLKVITTLKRCLTVKDDIQRLSFAYLVFFSSADKDIEVSPNKKIPPSTVLPIMQKYTLMPGKMIQTCRKVVEFIHKKLIPSTFVKSAQEILSKIDQQSLMEIDRTGAMLILHDFLRACFAYYWAYTQEKRNQSPSPGRRFMEIEENEAEFDLGRSEFNSTPVKLKSKTGFESRVVIMSKSESTKSFDGKEGFEGATEERFKKFLKGKKLKDLGKIENRLMIVDEFEKEIRSEIRELFLEKFMSEKELRKEIGKRV